MQSEFDLLKAYQQNREEIDVLTDEQTLFTLALVNNIGRPTIQELNHQLRWDSDRLITVCTRLQKAGMVSVVDIDDPMNVITPTERGKKILALVFTSDNYSASSIDISQRIDESFTRADRKEDTPLPEATLGQLTEAEWTDMWQRLRLYAYKNFAWTMHRFRGVDLEDIIQDAIIDVYVGRRRVPPKTSLTGFLCHVVRSKVSHMWHKSRSVQEKDVEWALGKRSIKKKKSTKRSQVTVRDNLLNTFITGHPHLSPPERDIPKQLIFDQLVIRILERVQGHDLLIRLISLLEAISKIVVLNLYHGTTRRINRPTVVFNRITI